MATVELTSARLKLDRAREHRNTLHHEITSFPEGTKDGIVGQCEGDPPEYVVRLGDPTARWGLIVGDCIHNLRASLDHIVWEALQLSGGTPNEKTAFPIQAKPRRRPNGRLQAWPPPPVNIPGMDPKVNDLIERLQPHHDSKRGDDPDDHPLARIHGMDIIDKHRRLEFANLRVDKSTVSVSGQGAYVFHYTFEPNSPVAWFPNGPSNPDDPIHADFAGTVSVEGLGDGNVIEALDDLCTVVEHEVLAPAEAILSS